MNRENVSAELQSQSNSLGILFVLAELDAALSFLDIADHTSNAQRQWRLYMRAKNAHTKIQRTLSRFTFSPSDATMVDSKVQEVRNRLQRRGILSAAA